MSNLYILKVTNCWLNEIMIINCILGEGEDPELSDETLKILCWTTKIAVSFQSPNLVLLNIQRTLGEPFFFSTMDTFNANWQWQGVKSHESFMYHDYRGMRPLEPEMALKGSSWRNQLLGLHTVSAVCYFK